MLFQYSVGTEGRREGTRKSKTIAEVVLQTASFQHPSNGCMALSSLRSRTTHCWVQRSVSGESRPYLQREVNHARHPSTWWKFAKHLQSNFNCKKPSRIFWTNIINVDHFFQSDYFITGNLLPCRAGDQALPWSHLELLRFSRQKVHQPRGQSRSSPKLALPGKHKQIWYINWKLATLSGSLNLTLFKDVCFLNNARSTRSTSQPPGKKSSRLSASMRYR